MWREQELISYEKNGLTLFFTSAALYEQDKQPVSENLNLPKSIYAKQN